MRARLLVYEYVPAGFEIVIENTDVEMGKIWGLWWNAKQTDDPERWNTEIKSINRMQSELSELSMNQRLIRAQIAEFCRLHPLFPRSIDILCREIGEKRLSNPVKIGCEGRGLLDSLGHHEHRILNRQLEETLTDYVESLEKWLGQGQAETTTESKVFGFLGPPTDRKVTWVEKLVHMLDPKNPSVSSLQRLAEDMYKEKRKDFDAPAREQYLGRPFNCFKCLSAETSSPECQCRHSMLLDTSLLCAGTLYEKRSMLEEFRCFVEENILTYAIAINSWLKGASPKLIAWPRDPRYVSKESASRIVERIHSSLGEKDETKNWLTVCLLKTLKDNQRWHKRTELIDSFPEATSWLKETPW